MTELDRRIPEENSYNIRSIHRAMKILMAFDLESAAMSIGDISKRTKIPKSTVHRIVESLIQWGMLEVDPKNGRYRLGLRLFVLGCLVMARMDIRKEASFFLHKLCEQFGETVHLLVRDGNRAIYIDKVEPSMSMVRYSQVGKHLPLYCTAAGKVLIADMSPDKIEALLGTSFEQYTSNTITSLPGLLRELESVRASGYSVDNEELEVGLKCIAAPVFNWRGEVCAGVSVSTLTSRLDDSVTKAIGREVKLVAREISVKLGYTEAANGKYPAWA